MQGEMSGVTFFTGSDDNRAYIPMKFQTGATQT